jgi:hypothetical protein
MTWGKELSVASILWKVESCSKYPPRRLFFVYGLDGFKWLYISNVIADPCANRAVAAHWPAFAKLQ